jgi:hypothetical protein
MVKSSHNKHVACLSGVVFFPTISHAHSPMVFQFIQALGCGKWPILQSEGQL